MRLTFGEQVKIVINRRGITIKELAEMIEEKTGKKMSRQNLTQRLGRDNFQEQDMYMIAEVLGCHMQVSLLEEGEEPEVEDMALTTKEEKKVQTKRVKQKTHPVKRRGYGYPGNRDRELTWYKNQKPEETIPQGMPIKQEEPMAEEPVEQMNEEEILLDASREVTIGELAGYVEEPEPVAEEIPETNMEESGEAGPGKEVQKEPTEKQEESKKGFGNVFSRYLKRMSGSDESKKAENSEPVVLTEVNINPQTKMEYESNSVRKHPSRIGYVLVYDRGNHQWTEMTEWAFLGYQEQKKLEQGEDYEEPIYLDEN